MSHQQAVAIILLLDSVFSLTAGVAGGLRCEPDEDGRYPTSLRALLFFAAFLIALEGSAGLL